MTLLDSSFRCTRWERQLKCEDDIELTEKLYNKETTMRTQPLGKLQKYI